MDHIKAAFDAFKRHPLQWFLLGLLFGAMSNLVVGIFLLPNFIRIVRVSAPVGGPPPEIGDLFNLDHIGDDVVTVVLWNLALFTGACFCGVGTAIVAVLGVWTQHLCADRLYAPIDCLRASFHHAKSNAGTIIPTLIIFFVVFATFVVLTCFLGALVIAPIAIIALERFYAEHRDAIVAAADAAGVPRLVESH